MNKEKIKTLAWRLGKGFLAGAISTMAVVIPTLQYSSDVTWTDLGMWVGSLSLAGIIGGLTGLILVADKMRRL